MDARTAEILDRVTSRFYDTCADSFSSTRQAPWPGWQRLLEHIPDSGPLRIMDVGCGNMRFERFLKDSFPLRNMDIIALDRCPKLADEIPEDVEFLEIDFAKSSSSLNEYLNNDLVVSFATLHHVPTPEMRKQLLRRFVDCARPGGITAVSFWQFIKSDKLARQACRMTEKGCLELGITLKENDYLLGWQSIPDIYRYCHNFTDEEIDSLVEIPGCKVFDSYQADNGLNRYVILKRDID